MKADRATAAARQILIKINKMLKRQEGNKDRETLASHE
jgi:hypothetical protein